MAIPKKLRLFTLFVDGENFIGKVPSVTLPKLTRKTEDYQGGGMVGSVAVNLGHRFRGAGRVNDCRRRGRRADPEIRR